MKTNFLFLVIPVLLLLVALVATPQKIVAQETKSPPASIDDLTWIAGHWQGEAMGGAFEETWSLPQAGAIMGMFKFVQGDKIGFYEFLTIVPQDDSLILRLKHFHADLKGWEEKDKTVDFPLLKLTEDEAKFDGLTFKKISDDEMHIIVMIDQGEGAKPIEFICHRADKSGHATAIGNVLKLDELISVQRNEATRKISLADAIESYVLGLDRIDFAGCPEAFTAAFKKHRDAWHESIEFFQNHPDLRGEMHELFERVGTSDAETAKQLKTHLDAIMGTWREIETAQQGTR